MRPLTDEEREIVAQNFPLAKTLARNVARRHGLNFRRHGCDLIQAAAIALMKAVQTHDPEKGTLATHAGWQARCDVPREWHRSFLIRIPHYQWEARGQSPHENAAETARQTSSIDALNDFNPPDDYEERAEAERLSVELREALEQLPKEDREIIEARFLRGESQTVVGRRINRCRPTISTLERRALKRLKKIMEAET